MTELCRGKRTDNGEWIYGDVMKGTRKGDKIQILHNGKFVSIISRTASWSDSTKDMYGKHIYEGDFLKDRDGTLWLAAMNARSKNFSFIDVKSPEQYTIFGNVKTTFMEIVGNIHDNLELLKDGEKK
ncbi:MAG: YopX family protein [Ruminococcus sp.]|nr:YopX family protein [Ruminococcus sp.]